MTTAVGSQRLYRRSPVDGCPCALEIIRWPVHRYYPVRPSGGTLSAAMGGCALEISRWPVREEWEYSQFRFGSWIGLCREYRASFYFWNGWLGKEWGYWKSFRVNNKVVVQYDEQLLGEKWIGTRSLYFYSRMAARRIEKTAATRSVVVAETNKKTIREFLPISEKTRTQ